MEKASKPVICVDLDGVLNTFDRWRGSEFFHPARPGAREFLESLKTSGFEVIVFTVRYAPWVERWLAESDLSPFVDSVTDRKPPAHVYLDDRAVCFRGDFTRALREILAFRPHWETPSHSPSSGDAGLPERPTA